MAEAYKVTIKRNSFGEYVARLHDMRLARTMIGEYFTNDRADAIATGKAMRADAIALECISARAEGENYSI